MLKSWLGGVGAAHVILLSAQRPNPSFFGGEGLFFDLGACWDKGFDFDLDQGLTKSIGNWETCNYYPLKIASDFPDPV